MSDPANIGDAFDVGGGEASASPDRLELLYAAARKVKNLELTIEGLESDLEATRAEVNALKTKRMPELMSELRMPDFVYEGFRYYSKRFVNGSLPKEEPARQKAMDWLNANDGADLFKTSVTVEFGRSGHNLALDLAARLEKDFPGQVKTESGVHAQSLCAWARERLDHQPPLPVDADTLGLFIGKATKFEIAKTARAKTGGRKK